MKIKPSWLLLQNFILVSLVAIMSGASAAKAQSGNMSDATGPNTSEVTTNSSGNIMTLPANFGQSAQDVTNPAPADAAQDVTNPTPADAVPMPSDTPTEMPATDPAPAGTDMAQPQPTPQNNNNQSPQNQQNPNNQPLQNNQNQQNPNNQPPQNNQNQQNPNNQQPQNNQNQNNQPPQNNQNQQNPNNQPPQNNQNQNNPPPQNNQNQNNQRPPNQQNQNNQPQQNNQNLNNQPSEQSGQNNASSTQEPPAPPPPPAAPGPNNFAPRPVAAPINGGGPPGPQPPPAIFSAYSQIVRSQLESGSEKKEILLALGGGTDAENLASSLQGILVNVSEAGWQVDLDKLEIAIENYNTFIEDSPPEFLLAPPIMLVAIRDELMLWKKLVEGEGNI